MWVEAPPHPAAGEQVRAAGGGGAAMAGGSLGGAETPALVLVPAFQFHAGGGCRGVDEHRPVAAAEGVR